MRCTRTAGTYQVIDRILCTRSGEGFEQVSADCLLASNCCFQGTFVSLGGAKQQQQKCSAAACTRLCLSEVSLLARVMEAAETFSSRKYTHTRRTTVLSLKIRDCRRKSASLSVAEVVTLLCAAVHTVCKLPRVL